ncbi:LysR family transcriptional regulator [Amycolatopsis suaedae]|uniref:LysR family transcriptional regulator n=1 Tax=Amycolatopsis suaedae TaxID=2510978 RepID=A0A4Q7JAG7_9PSEU|nr:LysR family transcriptional regulator [Amycolatopsis suaedae]RZQ64028.1 LysR family transcriptional regulator [Amycolatopsis suaedae]
MLDVRRLQVLRAVVTSGSISAAARNLGYTPSAVSQQLATLEREAGIELLERAGRGVRATAAGLLLSGHAEEVTAQLAKAEAELAELKAGRTGRLAIRYFATAGAALLPPAVAAVRTEFPGVRLDLRLFEPDDPVPQVVSGEADVAIVVSPRLRPVPDGVEVVHLLDDPYRAVLPAGHPLAERAVVDLADLAEEPWVGNEPFVGPCRELILKACGAAGFAPRFTVEADDFETAQGFVAAGVGVTLLPELGLDRPHPGVVVRKVTRPEPVRAIAAAVSTRARDRPVVRRLLAELAVVRRPAPASLAG